MTAARQASDQLTRRLVDLARQGIRPRCGDYETSDYWTSEHKAERKQAAQWCTGCPRGLNAATPPRNMTKGGASGLAATSPAADGKEARKNRPFFE